MGKLWLHLHPWVQQNRFPSHRCLGLLWGLPSSTQSVQLQDGFTSQGQNRPQLLYSQSFKGFVPKVDLKNSKGVHTITFYSITFRVLRFACVDYHWSLRRKLSKSFGLDLQTFFGRTAHLFKIIRCFDYPVPYCQLFSLHARVISQISPSRRNDPHVLLTQQEVPVFNRMVG